MDEALVKKISECDVLCRPSFNKTTKDYYIVAVVPAAVAELYECEVTYYDCTQSGSQKIQSDCCVFPYKSYYNKPIKYSSRAAAEKKLAIWKEQIESANEMRDGTGDRRSRRMSAFNAMLGDPATEFAIIEIETKEIAQNTYSVLTPSV